jgi:hypothetical protein
MTRLLRKLLFLALAALALGAALAPAEGRAELVQLTRVLLVGNSYTHFHSLSRQIEKLAASTATPLRVDAVTHGGYTLRMHWMKSAARARIASGGYRYVVLQDHSLRPLDHLDEFHDYGERFARAAISAGAKPVLYQTWPRNPSSRFYNERTKPRSADEMASQLDQAYSALADSQGALLAPVGRAFTVGLAAHPEVELYGRDGTHPSWAGSYLAACVLYGTLTGKDPRNASYVPWELPAEQAPSLRALAARVLELDRSRPVPAVPQPAPQPITPPELLAAPSYLPDVEPERAPEPSTEPAGDADPAQTAVLADALVGPPLDAMLDPAPFMSTPREAPEADDEPTADDDYAEVECNDDLVP